MCLQVEGKQGGAKEGGRERECVCVREKKEREREREKERNKMEKGNEKRERINI